MLSSGAFRQCFLILFLLKGHKMQKQSIPEQLLECYDDEITLLPMTMGVFIEIIRKIEMSPYFLMDIRTFSSVLFHRFSRDGIERDRDFVILDENVIPFTTTGFQSYKYQLISYYLLPKHFQHFPEEVLSLEERCTLHFMLSSSVEIWERGDENLVCFENFKSQNTSLKNSRRKSSCPIEKGVIETKFGTVSPNHLISAIATALQPLQVLPIQILKENRYFNTSSGRRYIDNRWVSSFSGDLAEMLLIQKPILKQNYCFGPGGMWNNTRLPINYYIKTNNEVIKKELWQFTNAEINGAIDGMRLGNEAVEWSQTRRMLRLSHLLELYYTDKYTNHLHKLHACKRQLFFDDILKNSNTLVEQVQSFSYVMSFYMPNFISEKSAVYSESETLVNQFNTYVTETLFRNQEKCPKGIKMKKKIKLNVIYDNTWSEYETLTFVVNLVENIDLTYYNSIITVIAGDTSNVIAKDYNSMGDLFLNWKEYIESNKETGTMSLPENLVKLNLISLNESTTDTYKSEWYSHVTIILGMSTSLTDQDIVDSKIMIKSIKQQNPDMVFIYVTSTPLAPMYVKLTSVPDAQNDKIITSTSNHQSLEVLDILNFNPIAIKPTACSNATRFEKNVEMKEYVRPGSINLYRIHPQYLCQVPNGLVIKIRNENRGNLFACVAREDSPKEEKDCQQISLGERMIFQFRNPCPSRRVYGDLQTWDKDCKPIYLRVTAKQSLTLCTDNECLSPDDVSFIIVAEGMPCFNWKNSLCNGKERLLLSSINLLIIIFLTLKNLISNHHQLYKLI